MFRIDDATAATSLPAPESAGTPGYFTEGNPTAGTPATNVRGSWLNMIQEELMALVTYGAVTPNKTTFNQVLTALQAKFAFINGSTGQAFNVAAASAGAHAVNRDTGDARYAGIAGNAAQAFAVANASIASQALAFGQMTGQLLAQTLITSSQTWTPNAKAKFAIIRAVGGGGAGGGAQGGGGGTLNMGGGGGAGGYIEALYINPTAQVVTIGAAGIGVSGAAGGNGGNTTIGALLAANAGFGGPVGALITTVSNSTNGAQGGVPTGFGLLIQGGYGGGGYAISTLAGLSGAGASGQFGSGGPPSTANNTTVVTGQNGVGRGSGGSGAIGVNNGSAGPGGNGTPGVVIIYEYGTA